MVNRVVEDFTGVINKLEHSISDAIAALNDNVDKLEHVTILDWNMEHVTILDSVDERVSICPKE